MTALFIVCAALLTAGITLALLTRKYYVLAKDTKQERDDISDAYMNIVVRDLDRSKKTKTLSVTYTFTESDFIKYKQFTARKKAARMRMATALASKIVRSIKPAEIIEEGKLTGYKYDVDVITRNAE